MAFAAAFAAVSWLERRTASLSALPGIARVVLPAALLGIAVIRVCEAVPIGRRPLRTVIAVHGVGCLAYPLCWIAAVNVMNNAVTIAATGVVRWRLPPTHVLHWHAFAGVAIYVALAALTYGRGYAFQSEQRRLQAEWRLLRGQLNPHFLFNTLHTMFGLAQTEPEAGEAVMTRFSRILRYVLLVNREDRALVPLRDEWAFTEDYLHLEAERLDHRLRWRAELEPNVHDVPVPPLFLQSIVENAVRHSGVSEREGGEIVVAAHQLGGTLHVRVSDNGRGTTREAALGAKGVGLRAVRARAQAAGSDPDVFAIDTVPGGGFTVRLRLPVLPAPHAGHEFTGGVGSKP
jgi:hypothetical protein